MSSFCWPAVSSTMTRGAAGSRGVHCRNVVADGDRERVVKNDGIAVEIGRLNDVTEIDLADVEIARIAVRIVVVDQVGVLVRVRIVRIAREIRIIVVVEILADSRRTADRDRPGRTA